MNALKKRIEMLEILLPVDGSKKSDHAVLGMVATKVIHLSDIPVTRVK